MKDISKLTDKIIEEANAYGGQLAKETEQECADIAGKYEEQAAQEAEQIIEAANNAAEAIIRRATSQAGITQRSSKLEARRKMIDEAFLLATKQILALPEDKMLDLLSKMAVKSQTTDATMIWGKGDKALAGKVVDEVNRRNKDKGIKLAIDEKIGDFEGGFILKEGSVETNCTFSVLIGSMSEELESEVAKALLG